MCHITGWLNAYKEGGWLPSWASPGYRNCMVGTFADVVVADAIVKNVPNFDLALAKEALLKDASNDCTCRQFFLIVYVVCKGRVRLNVVFICTFSVYISCDDKQAFVAL